MQHCPACNTTYPEGTLAFCPTDRIPLISDAPTTQPAPQANVIIAPMQSQREHTISSTPVGSFLKFLLNITIIGRLLNTDTMGQKYLIMVEDKEYPVSMETYYKLKPGQMVEIHLDSQSGNVLGIYPSKEAIKGSVKAESNISPA